MTLLETIRQIEGAAMRQPSVNMIVRSDVFRLNDAPQQKYGVFAWLQRQHSGSIASDLLTYGFTFFYVDRLTEDQHNRTEIQSVGVQTLDNIIRSLSDAGLEASSWNFTAFSQRFADECAGVYCNVELSVPRDYGCALSYGDYNEDYNDDFLIF